MIKKKVAFAVGKRKKAVARATAFEGKGIVRINGKPLELIKNKYVRLRIKEPMLLAEDAAANIDINLSVDGGGIWGQADACRTAIANAIVLFTKDKALKEKFLDYDRFMIISDARRTEPHKPSRSSAGPRRKKQQSKR